LQYKCQIIIIIIIPNELIVNHFVSFVVEHLVLLFSISGGEAKLGGRDQTSDGAAREDFGGAHGR